MGIVFGYNPVDGGYTFEDNVDKTALFKVLANGVGLFGKAPAQQSHIADPLIASLGAAASLAGNVDLAAFNNAVGSLNYLINDVGGKVTSILAALENYGFLKTV